MISSLLSVVNRTLSSLYKLLLSDRNRFYQFSLIISSHYQLSLSLFFEFFQAHKQQCPSPRSERRSFFMFSTFFSVSFCLFFILRWGCVQGASLRTCRGNFNQTLLLSWPKYFSFANIFSSLLTSSWRNLRTAPHSTIQHRKEKKWKIISFFGCAVTVNKKVISYLMLKGFYRFCPFLQI